MHKHKETAQARAQVAAVADSLPELIGSTPLLRLHVFDAEIDCELLVKLESQNPGGSVKDRTALALIEYGEQTGQLRPGGTIVEPTSGNTGLGLAMLAAHRGYNCVFTVLDKVSEEKINLLRAYGAEVIVCPTAVTPEDPRSYYSVADRITAERRDTFQPNQYQCLANRETHYVTTGPEIWQQTSGQLTHFVAGAGTGGTISGVGRFLREQERHVSIICADPIGSLYSGDEAKPYLVEGVGEDFIPPNYDEKVIDEVLAVSDAEAFSMCSQLVRKEGLLLGGSGGLAVAAGLRVAKRLDARGVVVVLIPDSGRAYVSKVYSDKWLATHGLSNSGDGGAKVRDVLPRLDMGSGTCSEIAIPAGATRRSALEMLASTEMAQLPVALVSRPSLVSQIVGSVKMTRCWGACAGEAAKPDEAITTIMEDPLPLAGIGETVAEVVERSGDVGCVVIADEGRPVCTIAVSDMLTVLQETRPLTV